MIRPFTILCMLLAAGSGLYLYHEKHRASVLDREIAQVVKTADAARERTGMLRAEWTLLNEPDRLQQLASRFLTQLQPMAPSQFVQMAALESRLPPVAQPPAAAPADDQEDTPVAGATPVPPLVPAAPEPVIATAMMPAPSGDAAGAPPAATPVPPSSAASPGPTVRMADAVIGAAPRPAKPAPAREAPPRRKAMMADAGLQTGPSAEPRPLPTRRVATPIVTAFATAHPMQINRPVMVQRAEAIAPMTAPGMTASVLGGGGARLPPPVPLGGGGG